MMTYSLTWMPDVLKAAGLRFVAVDGWQTAGHGDFGKPLGVLCHHTCGPADGDIKDLGVLVHGRTGSDALAGPLCNLALARSGLIYVVAAGRAYHAGGGDWKNCCLNMGNSQLIGIEAENTGLSDKNGVPLDPWPAVQMDAYYRMCAALLKHIGRTSDWCIGHKEYALPHGRKDDPNFDMSKFRADVDAVMNAPPPAAPLTTPPAQA